jgi:hypothetical protein
MVRKSDKFHSPHAGGILKTGCSCCSAFDREGSSDGISQRYIGKSERFFLDTLEHFVYVQRPNKTALVMHS